MEQLWAGQQAPGEEDTPEAENGEVSEKAEEVTEYLLRSIESGPVLPGIMPAQISSVPPLQAEQPDADTGLPPAYAYGTLNRMDPGHGMPLHAQGWHGVPHIIEAAIPRPAIVPEPAPSASMEAQVVVTEQATDSPAIPPDALAKEVPASRPSTPAKEASVSRPSTPAKEASASSRPTPATLVSSAARPVVEEAEVVGDTRVVGGTASESRATVTPVKPDIGRTVGQDATRETASHASEDAAAPNQRVLAADRAWTVVSAPTETTHVSQAAADAITLSDDGMPPKQPAAVKPAAEPENNRQDGPRSRSEDAPAWGVIQRDSSERLPGFQAADSVRQSNGELPPETVLSQKMIHQIVKAARVHLFDGGADMTLRLDPPHLGALQMNVSAQEGVVTATLQTSTETAKQVLEAGLPLLRQALSAAGIQVDSVSVSVGANSEQGWNLHGGLHHEGPHAGTHGNPGFGREATGGDTESMRAMSAETRSGAGFDYLA